MEEQSDVASLPKQKFEELNTSNDWSTSNNMTASQALAPREARVSAAHSRSSHCPLLSTARPTMLLCVRLLGAASTSILSKIYVIFK